MMSDFKEPIPHTGGVLTIHKSGNRYSLQYEHMNPHAVGLVELIATGGKPVAAVPIRGMSLREESPAEADILVMLPTDREGMYGRRCAACGSYFRTSHPFTERCPYCPANRDGLHFFTDDQLVFIERQYRAIVEVAKGPDGDTRIDFDAQVAEPTAPNRWVYSEERQQRHVTCSGCRLRFDVLGDYVPCPQCDRLTARDVITEKLGTLSTAFEADAAQMLKDTPAARTLRESRWRQYASSAVAEFEAFGRHIGEALSLLPATPGRRKAIRELSFQGISNAADRLQEWFGFDIFRGVSQDDRMFLHRMFHRRHLFTHTGGKVDQEYLDKTGDTSVRLNEVVRISSKAVRRLLALVGAVANNLLDDFGTIERPQT